MREKSSTIPQLQLRIRRGRLVSERLTELSTPKVRVREQLSLELGWPRSAHVSPTWPPHVSPEVAPMRGALTARGHATLACRGQGGGVHGS
jgi:hypothetical protein